MTSQDSPMPYSEFLGPLPELPFDPAHRATCDWNMYREQRPDPELCNLECGLRQLDDEQGN